MVVRLWLVALVLILAGCAKVSPTVLVREAQSSHYSHSWHTVRRGETLYAVAWLHDSDYRDLAKLNRLKAPYALKIGQRLRLVPRAEAPTLRKRLVSISRHFKVKRPRWQWPTAGWLLNRFAQPVTNKGINIAGRSDQAVVATAPGRVAYAGEGLRGYGKLLILKHNELYLSAYAHNRKLLVREGQWVKGGQVVARMGHSSAPRVMLHFEIRRAGKPVNPLRYLPKR
jgi:lipoprotein NlpD